MARKEPGGSGGTGRSVPMGGRFARWNGQERAPNREPSQGSTDEVRTSLSRVRTSATAWRASLLGPPSPGRADPRPARGFARGGHPGLPAISTWHRPHWRAVARLLAAAPRACLVDHLPGRRPEAFESPLSVQEPRRWRRFQPGWLRSCEDAGASRGHGNYCSAGAQGLNELLLGHS